MAHHLGNTFDIILQVGIDGDDGIGPLTGGHHTCHNSILMANIARHVDTSHVLVLIVELTDHLPRSVTTTIVDKHHHRVGADKPF